MHSEPGQMISQINWHEAKVTLKDKISSEDQRIVELLAAGESTPSIAKTLGTNRTAIWRRVQRIKQQLSS